jgi:hypothetical protein
MMSVGEDFDAERLCMRRDDSSTVGGEKRGRDATGAVDESDGGGADEAV